MRFKVEGSEAFRASLEKQFFLSSSVVSRRKGAWTFEVDDGIASNDFARALGARTVAAKRRGRPAKKHAGGRPPLPPEERRVRVTVTLPPALLERLRENAERNSMTVSAYVESELAQARVWP